MLTHKANVTFRIAPDLKQMLALIAQKERRSFSNQINVAIEEWFSIRNQLHPRFIQEVNASLKSGKPEPVWKG